MDFDEAAAVPGARVVTAVMRLWTARDAGHCELCRIQECNLRPDRGRLLRCLVVVERELPEGDHAMLSNHGGRMIQRMLF